MELSRKQTTNKLIFIQSVKGVSKQSNNQVNNYQIN